MNIQGRGAGYDDEPGDHIRKNAARDHVPARGFEPPPGYAFFHDRGLKIELHPRRDRGTHDANHHVQIGLFPELSPLGRLEGGDGCAPSMPDAASAPAKM